MPAASRPRRSGGPPETEPGDRGAAAPRLAGEALRGGGAPAEAAAAQALSGDFNRIGSARATRASIALFLAGFATFSLLYCPQPLLPTLARAFGLGAAASSLAISFSTGFLALSIVAAAMVSDRIGRKPIMAASLVGAAALNGLAALAPSWPLFLLLRGLEGVALGGVPAVAMTYLAEETAPEGLGLAMGIYVGSTAVGGMAGRVMTGILAALLSWRAAIGIIGIVGLVSALGFLLLLPASRHFTPKTVDFRQQARAFGVALRNPGLLTLYGFALLMMGGFVAVYNYAGFRLEADPYRLDPFREGLIFTLYLLGTVSSAVAGRMADRFGRPPVMACAVMVALLGIAASLFAPLGAVILGIALVTLGFFAAHAVASGSVGGLAGPVTGQAASLYLLSYYAGSSLLGTAGGLFWSADGWPAVAGFVAALMFGALVLTALLARLRRPS